MTDKRIKTLNFNITLLPGDGIGPEVVAEAVRVLEVITSQHNHSFNFQERLMGGCSIDKYGSSLTDETLADCQASDSVLLGAVGGLNGMTNARSTRAWITCFAQRSGDYNLRPVKVHPALIDASAQA
jgi:3-isopropylmalate dehydrogenase